MRCHVMVEAAGMSMAFAQGMGLASPLPCTPPMQHQTCCLLPAAVGKALNTEWKSQETLQHHLQAPAGADAS
eukprot:329107-Chlamydomonas_euryale.AAC.24